MGRWSRQIAPRFIEWLDAADGLDWLEVGCRTGALSAAILARCNPKSLISIDPSEGFVKKKARANVPDGRAEFHVGDAQSLAAATASRDVIVSALVLNFVPDKEKALTVMKRVARAGASWILCVGLSQWWCGIRARLLESAMALDPNALDLTEDRRFPFCTPDGLADLAKRAGLGSVDCTSIEMPTVFKDFEDYWHPFTLGAGPAPGYCMSLDPQPRQRLKEKLHDSLPRRGDGSIPLKTRAWAVKAVVG